jgi:tight adherence protein B
MLLSALPGAGVLLGDALGADPVGFLIGSHAGRLCLLSGALLVALGVGWTEAIVARAESP